MNKEIFGYQITFMIKKVQSAKNNTLPKFTPPPAPPPRGTKSFFEGYLKCLRRQDKINDFEIGIKNLNHLELVIYLYAYRPETQNERVRAEVKRAVKENKNRNTRVDITFKSWV